MINSSNTNSSSATESDVRGHSAAGSPQYGASRETPKSEFRNFISDIEDLIKASTSLSGDDLVRAKAALSARVHKAKESVEKMGGDIAEQARHTAKATNSYVHEHPWQSMGIGAAVGLLIGALFARSK